MKKPALFKRNTHAIALSLLLLASPQTVFAEDTAAPDPASPYSSTQSVVLEDGTTLDIVTANSPAIPPQEKLAAKSLAVSAVPKPGDVSILDVPALKWSYGASATAGAMIAGYYDRVGFANMYAGPTDGGCMPLENVWGTSDVYEFGFECPLSATKSGTDQRTDRGHVDDYFESIDLITGIGANGPDPYVKNGWEVHELGECTADYMNTSKWFPNSSNEPIFTETINRDGAAVFLFDPIDGTRVTWDFLERVEYAQYDAGYGLRSFFMKRGYKVATMYNQYIDKFKENEPGFGFNYVDYKAEIDAGHPVMLHLPPHIVVGIGYNDTDVTNPEIIFNDSFDGKPHYMKWGGVYYSPNNVPYKHTAVTIVTLTAAIDPNANCEATVPINFPGKFSWTMFLPAIIGSK